MREQERVSSLTIFFPFFNDGGTVPAAVDMAFEIGKQLAEDLEVIAIDGGVSKDDTSNQITLMKERHPELKVMDCTTNTEGYAVIKKGFAAASKNWVFYTDGDLQYDLRDLQALISVQKSTQADVVNGYRQVQEDQCTRRIASAMYRPISRFFFGLPIQDGHCDFRLIRTACLKNFSLEGQNGSVVIELIKKLQWTGACFAESPVTHRKRNYGASNYNDFQLFRERAINDFHLFFRLSKMKELLKPSLQ